MDNNAHKVEGPTESVSDQAKPSENARSSAEPGNGNATPTQESICAVGIETSSPLFLNPTLENGSASVKQTTTALNLISSHCQVESHQAKSSENVRTSAEPASGNATPTEESICAVGTETSSPLFLNPTQENGSASVKQTTTAINLISSHCQVESDQAKSSENVRTSAEPASGNATPTEESICAVGIETSSPLDSSSAQENGSASAKETTTALNLISTEESENYNNVMAYFQETDSAVDAFADMIKHAVEYVVHLMPISVLELKRTLPRSGDSMVRLFLVLNEVKIVGHDLCEGVKKIEISMRSCYDQKKEINRNLEAVASSMPLNETGGIHESIKILSQNLVSINNTIQRMKVTLKLYYKRKEEVLSILTQN